MKPTLTALGLALALVACSPKAEDKAAEATPAAPAHDMAKMDAAPAAAAPSAAKGTGVVTAVDTAAGVITIDHAPINEAGWPAMNMGFQATPALAQSVKVGDKVAFDLTLKDGGGTITAIAKQ
ncbi:copper-binding protein [Phenylobacterium sp.]|uniref:copper-binding protein n=1 Tax=Phenylobacterium sp. TaxID=1871053 RepID=UPI0027361582|nr:copper-binding protein [Phenylobacterium sp.]MDP3855775.1 copper-binding protein [Phenylobacterium sp.]